MQFSTKDGDHDKYSCATTFHTLLGGTVNAIVLTSMESIFMVHTSHLLIELLHFQGDHYSLKKTEMKIRSSEQLVRFASTMLEVFLINFYLV